MKIDIDTKERFKTIFIFLLQSYKVLMGSMLVIFVPQLCDDNKVCSITDNFYKTGSLHRGSLGVNFLSTLAFTICYVIELQRENWCIEYLDIDDNFGDNNLPLVLKDNPTLETALHKINDRYYYSAQVTAIIYMVNLIVSSVSIYQHSTGSPTYTAYLSFVILILMKLYNAVFISRNSKSNNMALSAYMTELQSFNVMDKDYLEKEDKKREAWVRENKDHGENKENKDHKENKENKKIEMPLVADLNII